LKYQQIDHALTKVPISRIVTSPHDKDCGIINNKPRKPMNFWIVILCSLIAISLHELGHAFAMLRHGVKIKSICLLGFGPKILEFRLRRWFGDVPIEIRLLPIGASVAAESGVEEFAKLHNRPFLDRIEICGAGIINNAAFAIFLFAASVTVHENNFGEWAFVLPRVLISAALIFILLKWQKWISLTIPLVGLAMLGFIIYLVTKNVMSISDTIAGPIETVKFVDKMSEKTNGIADALFLAGGISFALAAGNCFPFFPFDGGLASDAWIQKLMGDARYKKSENFISALLIIPGYLFMLIVLCGDIFKFISSFF
jgi:membrane-associated protease RseP (regulator of RpoE activity)